MPREVFEVSVDGFSGPLDLLCHLVESRQMQASRIKVAHLVRIYGAYLARTRSASAETIAEFFFMAAGLLLEKTRSLLPESAPGAGTDCEDPDPDVDEEAFLETLARYRPYREAARWLWERREREMRYFRRVVEEDEVPEAPRPEELEYDIGDLYFLSRVWWGLFEESQIQARIGELEEQLARDSLLSLRTLCGAAKSVKLLVVTLLALLEMCRMGKISIEQETLFSDVTVRAKS